MGSDTEKYAILEVPFYECPCSEPKCQYYYCFYQYWQTIHHKPIVGGYLARNIPDPIINFSEQTPFIRDLKNTENSYPVDKPLWIQTLKKLNIKYVILHRSFLYKNNAYGIGDNLLYSDPKAYEKQKQICDSFLTPTFVDNKLTVYAVPG